MYLDYDLASAPVNRHGAYAVQPVKSSFEQLDVRHSRTCRPRRKIAGRGADHSTVEGALPQPSRLWGSLLVSGSSLSATAARQPCAPSKERHRPSVSWRGSRSIVGGSF